MNLSFSHINHLSYFNNISQANPIFFKTNVLLHLKNSFKNNKNSCQYFENTATLFSTTNKVKTDSKKITNFKIKNYKNLLFFVNSKKDLNSKFQLFSKNTLAYNSQPRSNFSPKPICFFEKNRIKNSLNPLSNEFPLKQQKKLNLKLSNSNLLNLKKTSKSIKKPLNKLLFFLLKKHKSLFKMTVISRAFYKLKKNLNEFNNKLLDQFTQTFNQYLYNQFGPKMHNIAFSILIVYINRHFRFWIFFNSIGVLFPFRKNINKVSLLIYNSINNKNISFNYNNLQEIWLGIQTKKNWNYKNKLNRKIKTLDQTPFLNQNPFPFFKEQQQVYRVIFPPNSSNLINNKDFKKQLLDNQIFLKDDQKRNLIKNLKKLRTFIIYKQYDSDKEKLKLNLWKTTKKLHNQKTFNWIFKKYWLSLNFHKKFKISFVSKIVFQKVSKTNKIIFFKNVLTKTIKINPYKNKWTSIFLFLIFKNYNQFILDIQPCFYSNIPLPNQISSLKKVLNSNISNKNLFNNKNTFNLFLFLMLFSKKRIKPYSYLLNTYYFK